MREHAVRILLLLLVLVTLLVPNSATAQWQVEGVLVEPGPVVAEPRINAVPDGAGGMIVAWTQGAANSDIYVQHLNFNGDEMWTPGGVLVCGATGEQFSPTLISDGSGAIVVWQDRRGGAGNDDIYAQQVNAFGVPQWTTNGIVVSNAKNAQVSPDIVSDGSGGAIVAWSDNRGTNYDIYAQRVTGGGSLAWKVGGVTLCIMDFDQQAPRITSDGAHGVIAAWTDYRLGGPADIYAQRTDDSGSPLWTANGVPLCTLSSSEELPQIAPDGAHGAIIAWNDSRNFGTTSYDIYAQHVDDSGKRLWSNDGAAICTVTGAQGDAQIVSDGGTGAIISWSDQRYGNSDIFVQRVNALGAAQWTPGGVAVCTATGDQLYPKLAADGASGAIITWEDGRVSANHDVYTQKVNSAGAPQWVANGFGVCTSVGDQKRPAVVTDTLGGAVLAWYDDRSGVQTNLYAARMNHNGWFVAFVVTTAVNDGGPGSLWYAVLLANDTPGAQVIKFNIPGPGPHLILDTALLPLMPITDDLTIDGFTQPGSSPNTQPVGSPSDAQIKIQITGSGTLQDGPVFQAPGTLRGVALSGYKSCVVVQADPVVIEGCYIGTDYTGSAAGGNQVTGIQVGSSHCRIGGSLPAARNVICGAYQDGILIRETQDTEVYGNYIGVGADLESPLFNLTGIRVDGGATDARIGSSTLTLDPVPGEGNLIWWNLQGVIVSGATTQRILMIGNSYYRTGVPVDLGGDGTTPNDILDEDPGPNGLQNYPFPLSARGDQLEVGMTGVPNATYYFHYFLTDTSGGPYCCSEAKTYLGGTMVTLDPNGIADLFFTLPVNPPGGLITTMATDLLGNTSEVSYTIPHMNTPFGSMVEVPLVDTDGNALGSATFDSVSTAGNTVVTNPYVPPVPISGTFSVGNPNDPGIYFDVTTDVGYTGGIEICLHYDENNIPGPESNLVLAHYDGSMWVDVTTSRDEVNNIICGYVTMLSPFAVAVLTPTGVTGKPLPVELALHANVPNPFNPITTISYDVPAGGTDVNISIYDVTGRRVRELVDEHRAAGTWSVQWNGEDDRGNRVASGVYFYRMRAGEFVDTKKMVLLK